MASKMEFGGESGDLALMWYKCLVSLYFVHLACDAVDGGLHRATRARPSPAASHVVARA
jgi:hypothetical protein